MNEQTRYVMGIYQLALIIRDTVEYAINESEFSLDAYHQRGEMLDNILGENAPLALFCKQNGETGEKISRQVKEFAEDVYTKDARIMKIVDDKLVVDKGLIVQLLDYIVGLHETVNDILKGFQNALRNDHLDLEEFDALMIEEENCYRPYVMHSIVVNMCQKFAEFNHAKQEAKGENDPAVNFISSELQKLFGFANFVKQHQTNTQPEYLACIAQYDELVSYMTGAKPLEAGKTIKDILIFGHDIFVALCNSSRETWKTAFSKIYEQLRFYESSNNIGEKK